MMLTVVDPLQGSWMDVLLDADGETPISEIMDRLGSAMGVGTSLDAPASLFVDGNLVDEQLTLASSPLFEGSVVSLHNASGCLPTKPHGTVEVRVAGGPDAGAVHRLNPGYVDVGSSRRCRVRIDDPDVPNFAVRISLDVNAKVRVAPYEGVTASLDRVLLGGEAEWRPDSRLAVGSTLLELGFHTPDPALTPSKDGAALEYNRPPRLLPPKRQTSFKLPQAPTRGDSTRRIPMAVSLAPIVMAFALYIFFHTQATLAIASISPVLTFTISGYDLRRSRRAHRQALSDYEAEVARIEQDAREALAAERVARGAECPDPATILDIGTGPRARLWERRRQDADHLLLRVGTCDQPSDVTLDDPEQDGHRRQDAWTVPDVPANIPLQKRGVIGVAGPGEVPQAIVRWLVAQTAALSSPDDVQFYLLADSGSQQAWEWVSWLPHTRPGQGQNAVVLVGTDSETVAQRIAELSSTVSFRMQKLQGNSGQDVMFNEPDIVVVLDGSRRLRSLPGVIQILQQGPLVGVYAICLDTEDRFLPAECQAIVVREPDGLRVQQVGHEMLRGVRPDAVSPIWCQGFARALAPIRNVSDPQGLTITSSSRLLDVLQLDPPSGRLIADRWQSRGSSTLAIIGESFDGPFGIDIKQDGPHGLIAGTTGAGKSELLQTIVASLAVANTPQAMTFVLVDYKGGAAFKDCEFLPHTVGMVTDLDNHLVERALESLGAELKRREHILAEAGAKDIEDYSDIAVKNTLLAPMPRLLIVIDEFASMVRELPDFVTGLVNIAQRGRSLGVHLLLATQRPSGIVSPEIRANTNLRIALRVTDGNESTDVIDDPAAGFISKSTPGRGLVRTGANELTLFQTARISNRRHPQRTVPTVTSMRWSDLGRARPAAPVSFSPAAQDEDTTDLMLLVDAIIEANALLSLPAPRTPILAPLPDLVTLDELEPPPSAGELAQVPYGVDDLPALQGRRTAAIDFAGFGHKLIAGAPRTGRSQTLLTIAGSIAGTLSCGDVHIYGIDCGTGALRPLSSLPHTGAVVTRAQGDRMSRLLRRLTAMLRQRQELLATTGHITLTEHRAAVDTDQRPPHVVVLLDRWEGFDSYFPEVDSGPLTDAVLALMREGAAVGIHLVITGDESVLTGRVAGFTEDKLCLRLSDPSDFQLAGIPRRTIPPVMVPGRALYAVSGVEMQVAVLSPAAIAGIGAAAAERDVAVPLALRPFPVDDVWLLDDRFHVGDAKGLPIGREDVLAWLRDRSATDASVALLGPRRAGKTWVLNELESRLGRDGLRLVRRIVVPQPSTAIETPDDIAVLLDRRLRGTAEPAEALIDAAQANRGADRLVFLLDEVGRLAGYHPAAVSWLRDLGQAGAWLVYTGTQKDWHEVVRWALKSPGSSFGNDVDARILGPLDKRATLRFLTGTAANLGVTIEPRSVDAIVEQVGTWPFYLQVIGDAVVRCAQTGDRRPLDSDEELRRLIEERLLDGWTQHFRARWAEIGEAGRAALQKHPRPAPRDLAPGQRNDLRDVGLLQAAENWLQDRPFFDWMIRNATALHDEDQ